MTVVRQWSLVATSHVNRGCLSAIKIEVAVISSEHAAVTSTTSRTGRIRGRETDGRTPRSDFDGWWRGLRRTRDAQIRSRDRPLHLDSTRLHRARARFSFLTSQIAESDRYAITASRINPLMARWQRAISATRRPTSRR
jgi:hypothetical protein